MDSPTVYATAASILNAEDLKYDTVDVPAWGGTVRVREPTGAEREKYDQAIASYKPRGKGKKRDLHVEVNAHLMRVRLVWLTVVGKDGERLFETDASRDELAKHSARIIESIWDVSAKLSGLLAEDDEEVPGE